MKRIIAIATALCAFGAQAQVTCQTSGSYTFCSDGRSYINSGNMTFGSDGSTAIRSGNSTFINPPVQPVYTPPAPVYQPPAPLYQPQRPANCWTDLFGRTTCR